jgi:adenylate kinase
MASLILLMGATGAGKSAQSDLLQSELGWKHISSGRLLRQSSRYGKLLENGQLAPAAAVQSLVAEALENLDRTDTVILDGFPRTVEDIDWLDGFIAETGIFLRAVVLLEVDREVSLGRLQGRHRSDDTARAQKEKWRQFDSETAPVLNRYSEQGLLVTIDASGTIEEVHNRIKKVLNI